MGGGGPNRILRTQNSKNPVAEYQHGLSTGVYHAQSRPRPAPVTARPPKKC